MSGLRRWIPLAAILALLGAAMLAAVFANPTIATIPPALRPLPSADASDAATPPAQVNTTAPPRPPQTTTAIPSWITVLLTSLCIVSILALIAALVWASLRDRLTDRKVVLRAVEDDDALRREIGARVRAAVDEGLADLDDADMDPRRAVIACWVRLEAAAAAAGTPRSSGDTSTDLVGRLLGAHAISANVLAGFAEVYRAARFGTHAVDRAARDQARSALRLLRDELARSVDVDAR